MGGCGERTVRFRPSLVFQSHHLKIAMDILNETCKELY